MVGEPTTDDTIWTNYKTWPTRLACSGVVGADPHVVVCRVRLHRGRHDHSPDVAGKAQLALRCVTVVVRVEHQLDAQPFVFPVQLVVAEVMTDDQPALHAAHAERYKTIAGRIVREVACF